MQLSACSKRTELLAQPSSHHNAKRKTEKSQFDHGKNTDFVGDHLLKIFMLETVDFKQYGQKWHFPPRFPPQCKRGFTYSNNSFIRLQGVGRRLVHLFDQFIFFYIAKITKHKRLVLINQILLDTWSQSQIIF